MKKGVKYGLIIGMVIAAIAGGIYYTTLPLSVAMTEIKAQTAELSFTEQGVVVAENTVLIYPFVQGELTAILVEEGQRVSAGDIVCTVDDNALRFNIRQIQSAISGYEAQIKNLSIEQENMRRELQTTRNSLRGELNAIRAQEAGSSEQDSLQHSNINERLRLQNVIIEQNESEMRRVGSDYEMAKTLFESGVMARTEYEAFESALARALTALEVSKQELVIISSGQNTVNNADYYAAMRESLNARIDGINRQLEQDNIASMTAYYNALIAIEETNIVQLEREIEKSKISAPIDGIVTQLFAKNANIASPASPLAEITVPGNNIEVFVSTQDVSSIQVGDKVTVTLKQRTDDIVFPGTVINVDNVAEIRYSALGVEERKVKVLIAPDIAATNDSLGTGFAVDVRFLLYQEHNKLLVPKMALFKDDGVDKVWVVRGGSTGKAEAAAVRTGMELRTEKVIESGLNIGDFVISDANNEGLKNGVNVKP